MRIRAVFLLSILAGCSGQIEPQLPDNRILVFGSDMGVLLQNIHLSRANLPLIGAEVLVNGTTIPEIESGRYAGRLPAGLAAGATIRIEVRAGNDTVIGTTTVPAAPALLEPASGTALQIPTPLGFVWTDPTNPDGFVATIQYNGTAEVAAFGPAARSGIVVTSRIPKSATGISASVAAYADGTFSGPAAPGSRMHVKQAAAAVSLTAGP